MEFDELSHQRGCRVCGPNLPGSRRSNTVIAADLFVCFVCFVVLTEGPTWNSTSCRISGFVGSADPTYRAVTKHHHS